MASKELKYRKNSDRSIWDESYISHYRAVSTSERLPEIFDTYFCVHASTGLALAEYNPKTDDWHFVDGGRCKSNKIPCWYEPVGEVINPWYGYKDGLK